MKKKSTNNKCWRECGEKKIESEHIIYPQCKAIFFVVVVWFFFHFFNYTYERKLSDVTDLIIIDLFAAEAWGSHFVSFVFLYRANWPKWIPKIKNLPCSQCVCTLSSFNHVQLFATPLTVVCQIPLSMGCSRQDTGVGYHALL